MEKKSDKKRTITLEDIEASPEFQKLIEEFDQGFFDEFDPEFGALLRKHNVNPTGPDGAGVTVEQILKTPETQIPIRATYRFVHWAHWDREIHEAVTDFRQRCGFAPNIFIASESTHRRIDIAANRHRENILRPDMSPVPESEEFIAPSAFQGPDYELEYCMDDSIPQDHFLLVFDSDPDGGLPFPENDNLPSAIKETTATKKRATG